MFTQKDPSFETLESNTLMASFNNLTARQRTVLRFVIQDYTSLEIAAKLGISEQTVNDHRKAVIRELGISGKVAF